MLIIQLLGLSSEGKLSATAYQKALPNMMCESSWIRRYGWELKYPVILSISAILWALTHEVILGGLHQVKG